MKRGYLVASEDDEYNIYRATPKEIDDAIISWRLLEISHHRHLYRKYYEPGYKCYRCVLCQYLLKLPK